MKGLKQLKEKFAKKGTWREKLSNLRKEKVIDSLKKFIEDLYYQGYSKVQIENKVLDKYPNYDRMDVLDTIMQVFDELEGNKESLKEHTADIMVDGKKITAEVSGSGDKAVNLEADEQYEKDKNGNWHKIDYVTDKINYKPSDFTEDYNYPTLDEVAIQKLGKKYKDLSDADKKYISYVYSEWTDDSNITERLKESIIQLTGPYNIPKIKQNVKKLTDRFGLRFDDSNGVIQLDDEDLLRSELNELLGELKNMGLNYRVTERLGYNINNLKEKFMKEYKTLQDIYRGDKVLVRGNKDIPDGFYEVIDTMESHGGVVFVKYNGKIVDVPVKDIRQNPYNESFKEKLRNINRKLKEGSNSNVSELKADIRRYKRQLIQRAKKTGIWENFGQKEVGELQDKYDEWGPNKHEISRLIMEFADWAMNFNDRDLARESFKSEKSLKEGMEQVVVYKNNKIYKDTETGTYWVTVNNKTMSAGSVDKLMKWVDANQSESFKKKEAKETKYTNADGTFKQMTDPKNPDSKPSKFNGCVRAQMADGKSYEAAQKICGYIAKNK